jgi:hypothetical protein
LAKELVIGAELSTGTTGSKRGGKEFFLPQKLISSGYREDEKNA